MAIALAADPQSRAAVIAGIGQFITGWCEFRANLSFERDVGASCRTFHPEVDGNWVAFPLQKLANKSLELWTD